MRIGNGPRLVVPRPGVRRRRWGYYGNPGYERSLAEQRERIRRMPHATRGDAKPVTTYLRNVPLGRWCRQVDGYGQCFGPRLQREADLPETTRVRIVRRQEETLHSQLSRILKRAHKLSMRED